MMSRNIFLTKSLKRWKICQEKPCKLVVQKADKGNSIVIVEKNVFLRHGNDFWEAIGVDFCPAFRDCLYEKRNGIKNDKN